MLEILRDSVWQFVGVVLTVIGIAATFWIYWRQLQTKELAFSLVANGRLLAVADELSSRVTVTLDGVEVKNLHLLMYGLKNSGSRSIALADFERPLSVTFGNGQIVSAEIVSQIPDNLGLQMEVSDSRLELKPQLLNAGDEALIQVLLSAPSISSSIDARIVDVPTLARVNSYRRLPPFFQSLTPQLVGILVLIGGGLYLFDSTSKESLLMPLGFLGFAGFCLLHAICLRVVERVTPSGRRYIDVPPITDVRGYRRRIGDESLIP